MRAGLAGWLCGSLLLVVLPVLPPPWALWSGAFAALAILAGVISSPPLAPGWPRSGHAGVLLFFAAGAALLALSLGGLRGHALLRAQLPAACNRADIQLQGVIDSLPVRVDAGGGHSRQRFLFRVDSLHPARCGGPRRVRLSYYGDAILAQGQRWRFDTHLRRSWGLANPGSFNAQAWYVASGVHASGSVRGNGELLRPARSGGIGALRRDISAAIESAVRSPPAAAILRALAVGDKGGIDHRLWSLFQAFGANHLLVISGLHIGMVAGLCLLLAQPFAQLLALAGQARIGRCLPPLVTLAGAGAYSALAGFSLPTLRALCMLACIVLARLAGRRGSAPAGLLLAAVLLLADNPEASLGSGFWLSFSAVAALLWQDRWAPRGTLLVRLWRAHLYMALLMAPLGALYFGGASWFSAPANLVLVPAVGWAVAPLALGGCVLWLAGLPGAAACWRLAAWPVQQFVEWGQGIAGDGGMFLHLCPGLPAVALALLAVGLLVLPLRAGLLLLLLPLALPGSPPSMAPELTALDVGQGTAVVFTAGGHSLLYDTGGGSPGGPSLAQSVVLPWLRQRGIRRLDQLVISHADADHSAGADDVLAAVPVARFIAGANVRARRQAEPCLAGQSWAWSPAVRFRLLSPPRAGQRGNDGSCVLLIESPGLRILLAGDASQLQERDIIAYWGDALAADVLLVGHHGSATSTSQAWLNRVAPRVAIIGAGYASRFGHPHPAVLARLHRQGVEVHQNALEGAVSVRAGAPGELRVDAFREHLETWWK